MSEAPKCWDDVNQTAHLTHHARTRIDSITPELLRDLIDYNPNTGELIWRERPESSFGGANPKGLAGRWRTVHAGKPALAFVSPKGYLTGTVLGKGMKAHRVAWAIYHGKWPDGLIDHINRDRADNRISNLRECTVRENGINRKVSGGTSQYHGVCWKAEFGRWSAQINANGSGSKFIGYFYDETAAALAYDMAAIEAFGDFAVLNFANVYAPRNAQTAAKVLLDAEVGLIAEKAMAGERDRFTEGLRGQFIAALRAIAGEDQPDA